MAVFGKNFLDTDGLNALWTKIKGTFVPQTRTVNGQALSADVTISIPGATTTTPKMDGTAAVGTETKWAKGDHVHPTDTSRAPTSHASNATTYGVGTTANYGHNKLVSGDVNSQTYANGVAAAAAHTHSNYAASTHSHSASEITAGTFDAARIPGLNASKISAGVLDKARIPAHASGTTGYGAGTTANYGHVKLVSGNVNGQTYANGVAAAAAHTHSNYAGSSHTHGNIANGGTMTTTGSIAAGAALVFANSADNKLVKTTAMFDGSTTDKALTPKGTFETFLTAHQDISQKANLNSPTFSGTPKAPTPAAGTDTDQIATTKFVNKAVTDGLSVADAMVYKGVLAAGAAGSYGALTPSANKGWTYKVTAAGKIDGVPVEVGDMLICNTDNTSSATTADYTATSAKWDYIQTNLDGVVVGPAASTSGNFALFDGTNGKKIMNSTYSPASFAAAGHTHGNVLNNGTMTATATIGNGDSLVIADSDGSNKLVRTSITFDGSTTTQALTKKGTWATFNNYTHPAGNAASVTGKPTGNQTPAFGGTFTVSQVTTDDKSHVSSLTDRTVTIPSAVATTALAGLMSSGDKSKLNGIATGATKNSAFSTITVGSTNVVADAAADTLILSAGNYMSITPDATNDKISFAVTGLAPTNHASSTTGYGAGTTANYGHNKIISGDLKNQTYSAGEAAAAAHTHSQYLTAHQSITGKADKVHSATTTAYGAGTTGAYGHNMLVTGDLNNKAYSAGMAASVSHTHSQYLTAHQSITGKADKVHSATTTAYGAGTTGAYGHNKIISGDLKNQTYSAGEAAAAAHTHSQYLTAHQSITGKADKVHSATTTAYGAGTTGAYGHNKIISGDLNGKAYSAGEAAAAAHTHSQYLTAHQSITGKADKVHSATTTAYGAGTTGAYGHVKTVTGDMNGKSDAIGQVPSLNHVHSQYYTTANPSGFMTRVKHDSNFKGDGYFDELELASTITISSNNRGLPYAILHNEFHESGWYAADGVSLYGPGEGNVSQNCSLSNTGIRLFYNAGDYTYTTVSSISGGIRMGCTLNPSKNTEYKYDGAYFTDSTGTVSAGAADIRNWNNAVTGKAPIYHASTAATYGLGATGEYGHVKIVTGDMNGKSHVGGQVPALSHTHSQYMTTASIPRTVAKAYGHAEYNNKVNAYGLLATIDTSSMDGYQDIHAIFNIQDIKDSSSSYPGRRKLIVDIRTNEDATTWTYFVTHIKLGYNATDLTIKVFYTNGTNCRIYAYGGTTNVYQSMICRLESCTNWNGADLSSRVTINGGTASTTAPSGTEFTNITVQDFTTAYRINSESYIKCPYDAERQVYVNVTDSKAGIYTYCGTSNSPHHQWLCYSDMSGNGHFIGIADTAYMAKHYPYDYGRIKTWGTYSTSTPYFCIAMRTRSTNTANWIIGGLFVLEKSHSCYVKFKVVVRGQQQTIRESYFDVIETVNISESEVKDLLKGTYVNNTTDKTCAFRIYIHLPYTGSSAYEGITLRRLDYQSDYAGGGYAMNETSEGYSCIADDFWTFYKDITGSPSTTVASMTGTVMVTYYFSNRFVRSDSVNKIVMGSIGSDTDTLYII